MSSPCGGCPPCCKRCVFDAVGQLVSATAAATTVVTADDYGCVKGFGNIQVRGGRLGQMRNDAFHQVTVAGAKFLRLTGNPLANHLAT